jgi:hypothetical protein
VSLNLSPAALHQLRFNRSGINSGTTAIGVGNLSRNTQNWVSECNDFATAIFRVDSPEQGSHTLVMQHSKQTRRLWFWFWVIIATLAAWFYA